MKKQLDLHNGVTETFHHDPITQVSTIETTQDVEPYLEIAKACRNSDYSKDGIKAGWWHLAYLPDVIVLKLLNEDGVNIYDPNDMKKLGELINTKYSAFKMTDGKHQLKG